MASSLYIAIRGDYTQFQDDMRKLRNIAKNCAVDVSNAFGNAFSPKLFKNGLNQIGNAIKSLNASAAQSGKSFKPVIKELGELAKACSVSEAHMQSLANRMAQAAQQKQLENSLRTLQRQLRLTDAEVSSMQRSAHDWKGALDTAMKGVGIRSAAQIKKDIQDVKAAYVNAKIAAGGMGAETARAFEVMQARVREYKRELMTLSERRRDDYNQLWAKTTTIAPTQKGYEQYTQRKALVEGMSGFQELHGRLPRTVAEMRQLAQATGATTAQVRKLRDELSKSSTFFNGIIGSLKQRVFFGLGAELVDSIKTAMRVENVEVAFQAIYGTSDMAAKKLAYVKQVSDELGLSFLATAEGAKKLFAAAQGTPVEKDANMVFKAFSNMSAALKLTSDETKGVFLALSQMISKGKVSAEELRQQLAERMPGAVNLFAKSIGVTTQELDKMLQKGEVNLQHFVQFAAEVNKTYAAGAQMAGHSLQAELNRLGNTWVNFQSKIVDTGGFASVVRDLNAVLKPTLSIISELSKHTAELTAAGFVAWLGASASAGGKLNAVFASLIASAKASIEAYKGVAVAQTAVGATAATAGTKVKGLGAALLTMVKNPVVLTVMAAIGAALGVWAYKAYKAKEAFKDIRKTMSEYVYDMQMSKSADMASRFSPETLRTNVLADARTAVSDWQRDWKMSEGTIQKAMDDVLYKTPLKYKAGSGGAASDLDTSARDLGLASLKEAKKAAEDYSAALKKAVDDKDLNGVNNVLNQMAENWGKIKAKMVDSGSVSKEGIAFMEKAFAGLYETGSRAYADLTRWQQTFSADSISAAKALGLNLDALKKSYDGLAKAASSNQLGKAFADLQSFEKVTKYLGQTGASYDAATAAAGKYMDEVVNLTNSLTNSQKNHEELSKTLEIIRDDYSMGIVTSEEYRKACQDNDQQVKALSEQHDKLTTSLFNAIAAAGGTPAAFNAITAVFEQAARAGGMVESQISAIIGRLQDLMSVSANIAFEASALAGAEAAERQVVLSEMGVAVKDRDWEKYLAGKKTLRYEQQINQGVAFSDPTDTELSLWRREFEAKGRLLDFGKAGKKGGGKKGGGSKRVDNTAEKWHSAEEGWRKKIADMQGQKDIATLAKDFADMDKQLKGSSVDMKKLKTDYLEAFNGKYAKDLNKEILQLRGNEKALADAEIADKVKEKKAALEGMAEEAKKLGLTVQDYTPQLREYEELLKGQAREQELQKILPYYEKFSAWDGKRGEALALQNELIEIQAEKMKGTVPDELIARWKELEVLQNRVKNGSDVMAGIALGAKNYALEIGSFAQNVSDLVQKSFGDMADAFTDFVMTGKTSFSDLANSIIKDLMRIAIQQAIVGPIANGIGSLFSGFFGGGVSGAVSGVAGKIGGAAGGIGSAAAGVKLVAMGGAFTGLRGYSNQIVSRPTLFSYGSQLTRFAKGGVMGEAGPEAVMPLTRTASGHLGVRSEGANQPVVNVNIINSTGQAATQSTKTDGQGNKSIDVVVGDMAAGQMLKQGTSLNKAVRTFTGQQQQVTRR